ncbi:hypothetical protein ACULNC_24580 [Shigella flexneri]
MKTKGDSEQATPETLEQAVNAMLIILHGMGWGLQTMKIFRMQTG